MQQLAARPGPAARLPTARRQQQQQQQLWRGRRRRGVTAASAPRDDDAPSSSPGSISAPSTSAAVTSTPTATTSKPDLECVEVGMDVYCVVGDDNANASGSSGSPSATPAAETDTTPLGRLSRAAILVSPFFFWGTSMVAMKGVGPHATPLLLGAMRLLPAGGALVAWAASQGRPQPSTPLAWAWVAAFALVDGAAFQGFLAQGLERTSAGLGSVIIDSQPLTVAVLAALLFGERLGAGGVAGLALGVLGLVLLEVPPATLAEMLPTTSDGAGVGALIEALGGGAAAGSADAAAATAAAVAASASSPPSSWSLLDSGEFWMLLAAQSMAMGTVMVRYVTKHCDPVMATGWHMVLGGAALLGAALATGGDDLATRLAEFSASDAAAMLYVSMLGGAASYGVFFLEASRGNLTALSSLTFLTPMFAAAGDYVVRGATLTPLQLLGAGVALGGVALVSGGSGGGGDGGDGGEEEGDKAKVA